MITVRPLVEADRPWARERTVAWWGSAVVVAHGRAYEPAELDGFVAELDGALAGLVTYVVEGDACEIVSLNAEPEGRGVGGALIDAVVALRLGRRVCVTTTNDNSRAIAFYRARGFEVVAVHEGAVDRARAIKPEIPTHDERGVPIRDEIELERRV